MRKYEKGILITGCQRSGTSLMANLMMSFENGYVDQTEKHPFYKLTALELSKDFFVRKTPQFRGVSKKENIIGDFDKDTIGDVIEQGYRVIFMVRDGRDVQVSRHKKAPDRYWSQPWKWVESIKRAEVYSDHPNFRMVRYESLVNKPLSYLKWISDWTGSSPDGFENVYTKVSKFSEIGIAMGDPRPVDSNSIGKWKLPEHENRINEVLKYPEFKNYIDIYYNS